MTDLRKAAEMALYALELNTGYGFDHVIEALRQALAQPEQEPVAWSDVVSDGGLDPRNAFDSAPPKREWIELTDEEINEIQFSKDGVTYEELDEGEEYPSEIMLHWESFARAIEAKLKEKNNV